MNLLDMRTIVFSYLVSNIVCVWFIVLLWRQNRNRFAGTAFWVVDFIFQAAALFLIVLRGAIPDWISMVLANALVIAGAILGFMGLERFVEKKGPQIQNYLLLTLFIFVHGYFAFVQPSQDVRNFNISVALSFVCVQSVWLLWRRVEPGLRPCTFGVGMVNMLYCLVSMVRIVHFLIGAHAETGYLQSGLFEALVLVSYQILFIMLTYSFVMMVNKRLVMGIETQEEKFAKAFHSAPYAITLTHPSDGTIIDVNETFTSITGYDRTEVMGKKTTDLHLWANDEDRAAVVDLLSRQGSVSGMEMQFRNKNGVTIIGLFSAEVITIEGEKSILSSIGDITGRKRVEEALRERESFWRLSVDHMLEAYALHEAIFDESGRMVDYRFLEFNPAAQRIANVAREEIVGRTAMELFPHIAEQGLLDRYADVMATGTPTVIEDFYYVGDNLDRALDIACFRVDTRHFACVFRDITGRKQAEAALRRSEENFRRSMDDSPLGKRIVTGEGETIYANRTLLELYGYDSIEELETTPVRKRYTPESYAEFLIRRERRRQGVDDLPTYDISIVRKNGEVRHLQVIRKEVLWDGQRQFQVIYQDVTERKRANDLVEARLRIISAAHTKSSKDLMQIILDEIELRTGSVIGFYHFLMEDQETLTLQTWSTNTLRNMCTAEGAGSHYPISQAGVWVECVNERRPVIHNDYDSLPHRKGLPPGHAPVVRELVFPVFRNGRIVAIIGMGNKPTEYDAGDIGVVSHLGDFSWEIIERKRAEEKLRASLLEKELLLKEIHHRVKNNLQIIASLLRLNTKYGGDERVAEIFRESQDRIRAMAAVHSMLYKSESLAEINFGEYIRETARQLFRSYNTSPDTVSLLIKADDVRLPIDKAIPSGLIINELFSNALKHAFPDGRRGEILIEVYQDGNGVRILFADNGVGFLEEPDFRDTHNLGLQLVKLLVEQLDGIVDITRTGGTRYEITLKT